MRKNTQLPAYEAIDIFLQKLDKKEENNDKIPLNNSLIVPLPQKMSTCTSDDINYIAHCAHAYNTSPSSAFVFFTMAVNTVETTNTTVEEALSKAMSM